MDFTPDGIAQGAGEWGGVPRVVREAFRVLFHSLDDLKRTVREECVSAAAWEHRWAAKAEVVDVHHNLRKKADTDAVSQLTAALGDRMSDMTTRLHALSVIVSDLQNVHQINARLAALDASVKHLSSEMVKDRDDASDMHIKLDLLHDWAASKPPPPRPPPPAASRPPATPPRPQPSPSLNLSPTSAPAASPAADDLLAALHHPALDR
eukprot:TRINITY_DN6209_c0_g1_i1.p2 TRINITY_DN6209_c0_g1~~TRINITY_DN6209_c0_g1_i1.p2  ORF type:complete len:218 (+),score=85.97 TRINITY_DN6209_c0_g1_i1:32-655(+)